MGYATSPPVHGSAHHCPPIDHTLPLTRYTTGQHFLAHEDGFPPLLATANGFQRHATLLLYLNDVQQVGGGYLCVLRTGRGGG